MFYPWRIPKGSGKEVVINKIRRICGVTKDRKQFGIVDGWTKGDVAHRDLGFAWRGRTFIYQNDAKFMGSSGRSSSMASGIRARVAIHGAVLMRALGSAEFVGRMRDELHLRVGLYGPQQHGGCREVRGCMHCFHFQDFDSEDRGSTIRFHLCYSRVSQNRRRAVVLLHRSLVFVWDFALCVRTRFAGFGRRVDTQDMLLGATRLLAAGSEALTGRMQHADFND